MMPFRGRDANRVQGCSLFRSGEREPLAVVTEILRRSGVRIGKIDKGKEEVTGRIGSILGAHACTVTAHLYNQQSVSLVELVCEGGWRRPGRKVLKSYLEVLRQNLDEISSADIEKAIDWGRSSSNGKGGHRVRTEAVTLIRNIEEELR